MDLQKRTAIAVGLSILIVVIYSSVVSKLYRVDNKEVMNNTIEKTTPAEPVVPKEQIIDFPKQELRPTPPHSSPPIILEQDKVIFELSRLGGNLLGATFKDYNYKVKAKYLISTEQWSDLEFIPQQGTDAIIFKYEDAEKKITKKYEFSQGGYYINFIISYNNLTYSAVNSYYVLSAEFVPLPAAFDERFKEFSVMVDDYNLLRKNTLRIKKGSSLDFNPPFKWIGLRDKYFAYIFYPISSDIQSVQITKNLDGNDTIRLNRPLGNNRDFQDSFLYYCGPQIADTLSQAQAGFEQINNYGKLDALVKLLLRGLNFINKIVKNWGLSIIILTILIYFCLYPLTLKQMRSMKKMQVIQPEMEALKQQYKDNPQKLNKEIMELYRKHNANPLAGCFPILLQIPVFFSLFQALSRGIELKSADFLWIQDLSEPDRFLVLAGKDINLLPILMMIATFFQQKFSMRNMASSQSEQQKIMLWVMPLIFGFIFYNMPSGLVLYWFTNSILMMVSQCRALR